MDRAAADLKAVITGRHQAVHELRAAGKSQAEAAAGLGLSLAADRPVLARGPRWAAAGRPRPSALDPV